ncbi:hypothetical protein QUF72_20985 [Desulfobacterales bacterium HSG2]|nr:hypothetical protein [Desulfobacterales bacterium HSG2]
MCCEEKSKCWFPDKLKGKPKECSPDQIRECHGEEGKHPCSVPKKKK